MSIEQQRVMIARYMGMEGTDAFLALNYMYEQSWNLLMPVVKKIQQLPIEEFTRKKPVMSALMDVDIYILHQAVVVFVQWYTTTSPKLYKK